MGKINAIKPKKKIIRLFRDGIPIMILSNDFGDKSLLSMAIGQLIGYDRYVELKIEVEIKEE